MGSGGCCEHCASTDERLDKIERSLSVLAESFHTVKTLVYGAAGILLTGALGLIWTTVSRALAQ